MPMLTLTYDTGSVPLSRINDGFAAAYGYQPTINGSPNPETKAEFSRRMVREYIKGVVKGQEVEAARKTAEAGVTEITLT
jgi:hypothetical protein